MRRLTHPALIGSLLAAFLALLLLAPQPALHAEDPVPWEEHGGLDGYYIARGWTEGYSSEPLTYTGVQSAGETYSHTTYLPLILGGPAAPPPSTQPRETRALWVSRWDFKTARDVQIITEKAAYANLNVILFQVRGEADALYTPGLEPWSATLTSKTGDAHGATLGQHPGWDPLQEMLTQAHNRGIEVHAWINAYPAWLGTTPPPLGVSPEPMYYAFNRLHGNNWVQWRQDGTPTGLNASYLWGSPGNPVVADRIVAVCADLVTRYPSLDGLHFDYIRYDDQGRPYSYDPVSLQRYREAQDAGSTQTYEDWQRAQITSLLQRVRQEALAGRPNIRLTTSAWPVYNNQGPNKTPVYSWFPIWGTDGYNSIFQDSWGWARTGVADSIMPMFYTSSIHDYRDRFDQLCRDFNAGTQPGRFVAGIEGDYSSFEEIAWRIQASRDAGASGQALFSYRLFDQNSYWPLLRTGPYHHVAVPDWPER